MQANSPLPDRVSPMRLKLDALAVRRGTGAPRERQLENARVRKSDLDLAEVEGARDVDRASSGPTPPLAAVNHSRVPSAVVRLIDGDVNGVVVCIRLDDDG